MVRIPVMQRETLPSEVKASLRRLEQEGVRSGRISTVNLMCVLAHSPALLEHIRPLVGAMLNDLTLDPQLCELAILQLLHLNRCEHAFRQHMAIAKSFGLNDKQIANVGAYSTYPYYSDTERVVLEYTEAVTRDVTVADELFERVRQRFDSREIVELTMVIAYWNMMSRLLIPLEIELDSAD